MSTQHGPYFIESNISLQFIILKRTMRILRNFQDKLSISKSIQRVTELSTVIEKYHQQQMKHE